MGKLGQIGVKLSAFKSEREAVEAAALASLGGEVVWLNLSSGLVAASALPDFRVMRVQSTAFEQKRWRHAVESLPDEFLLNAALGSRQTVVDFGANKPVPRSFRQGLAVGLQLVAEEWGLSGKSRLVAVRRNGDEQLMSHDNELEVRLDCADSLKRVKIYKKFSTGCESMRVSLVCGPTSHDNDYELLTGLAKKFIC